jgi:hypothetical protein
MDKYKGTSLVPKDGTQEDTNKAALDLLKKINEGATDLSGVNDSLGARIAALEADNTKWEEWTPTFTGLGIPTGIFFKWRRVFESMEIQGRATAGIVTAAAVGFTLPKALTSINYGGIQLVGCFIWNSGTQGPYFVLANTSSNILTIGRDAVAGGPFSPLLGNSCVSNGALFSINASVQISQWI